MANPSTLIHLPSVATPWSDAGSSSSTTAAAWQATASPPPFGEDNVRRLTTIMPALVIGVLCFFAFLSVFTAWHSRRCRRQRSLMQNVALAGEVDRRHTKKKKRVVRRPRLFEVHLGTPQRDADQKAQPVAAELPSGCDPSKLSSLVVVPEKERRRPWCVSRDRPRPKCLLSLLRQVSPAVSAGAPAPYADEPPSPC